MSSTIHLNLTNNDVKGLKVVPLPISTAGTHVDADAGGPPHIIIQSICFELLELVEVHPTVKCDCTITTGEDSREDHTFVMPLPVVILKFALPWEVDLAKFDKFWTSKGVQSAVNTEFQMNRKESVPVAILTFGGVFHLLSRSKTQVKLAARLAKHGVIGEEYHIAVTIGEKLLEVHSQDQRLSDIVLSTLIF